MAAMAAMAADGRRWPPRAEVAQPAARVRRRLRPGQVRRPATGMLDVMTAAVHSSKEAALWRSALRPGASLLAR